MATEGPLHWGTRMEAFVLRRWECPADAEVFLLARAPLLRKSDWLLQVDSRFLRKLFPRHGFVLHKTAGQAAPTRGAPTGDN